jgi:hypothetical protein
MRKNALAAVAVSAAALAGLGAGPALAGELKGPPGGGTEPTPATDVAHSACAFSGLNDFVDGHTSFHVQSYGIDVAGKGEEPFGHPGLGEPFNCRGGGPAD